ncbi:unnamed protein product, partial [Urochloa humidicola]
GDGDRGTGDGDVSQRGRARHPSRPRVLLAPVVLRPRSTAALHDSCGRKLLATDITGANVPSLLGCACHGGILRPGLPLYVYPRNLTGGVACSLLASRPVHRL